MGRAHGPDLGAAHHPADQVARWRTFRRWFLLPAVAVCALAELAGSLAGVVTALIIVGPPGLLIAGYIVFKGLGLKLEAGVPFQRAGDKIVWGSRIRVPIDQIAHWTTYIWTTREQSLRWNSSGGSGSLDLGVVRFTMVDGREVMLTWTELT